jgi:hypothetical protein
MTRKSRALVGLGRLEEARDALIDGLQFEPEDKVGLVFHEPLQPYLSSFPAICLGMRFKSKGEKGSRLQRNNIHALGAEGMKYYG